MADLFLNIIGSDGASAPLRAVGAGFQELSKLALECTKAFEEQAKADRQLERYAKDLTPAFKAQAAAMQEQLGVSDDMVQTMQTMLLRFGEAPDQVEATTRALLDYSAATGEDAVSATRTLLSSVESGKAAFKDLGLVYEKTGHASADLASITGALAGKLGGSAQAEADSVAGQARIAAAQIDEFKESVGQLISEFITKTGALGTFTEALRGLQELLFNTSEEKYQAKANAMTVALGHQATALDNVKFAQQDLNEALKAGSGAGPSQIEYLSDQLKAAKRYAEEAKAAIHALTSGPVLGGVKEDRLTKGGRSAAGKDEASEKAKREADLADVQQWYAEEDEMRAANLRAVAAANEHLIAEAARADQFEADRQNKKMAGWEANREAEAKALAASSDARLKAAESAAKKLEEVETKSNQRLQQKMTDAAVQIGVAFGQALTSALVMAIEAGQDADVEGAAMDIGFGLAATVGSIIGSIYSPIIGSAVGSAIGGLGQIAGALHRKKRKEDQGKKHDGGWMESFHVGGWPGASTDEQMAMLQTGERVLSRQEVQRMGGKGGVDAAARGRGGGGLHVTVVAQDAQGVREFFEDRGGRGIFNAIRTGRGNLAGLVGK